MNNTQELKYFEGRFCTVFLVQINRNFKEENPGTFPQPVYNYFSGIVQSITNNGIWLLHPTAKCKSFYFMEHIVGITEEEILNPNDENDAKKIEEFKKVKENANKILDETPSTDGFLNVEALEKLNQSLKG